MNESPIRGHIDEAGKDVEVRIYTSRWEPVGVGDEDYMKQP